MKTYLVKIPQDNSKTASAFREVFVQLHETLGNEKVAFELVCLGQNTGFCFTASEATAEVVAGQIYALAADADIEEISDFFRAVQVGTKVVSAEIALSRHDLFPINDYRTFEGDSLSGLLSVLSKSRPGEGAVMQIVARSVRDTGGHQLVLSLRRKIDRIRHKLRFKYWFKREVSQEIFNRLLEKTHERLFRVNLRVMCFSGDPNVNPEIRLKAICGALANYNTLDLNRLKVVRTRRDFYALKDFKERQLRGGFFLSTTELATLYHLPNEDEVPNLIHVLSKKEAPPTELPTNLNDPEISIFGMTNFRGQHIPFGLTRADRRRHLYVLGKSGVGKSRLLQLLIRSDLYAGHGVGVLDPHGDLVDDVLRLIPKHRVKDVVLFDPSDLDFPPAFNPLEQVPEALKMRVTIGFIEIFKKLFGTNWSPRLEHVLRYTTLALLDTPGTTVLSILKMLTDKNYRQMIVRNIHDNVVKNFWVNEFAAWSEKFDNEAITPLLNKVGQFVATNMIRNIVGQPENLFDFRKMMDQRKILLMKVSKGILGEENASLLGAMAVTKVYQAAMSRADTLERDRVDFYFYVDEFHNFATDTFDEILSESRKYRLNLTIANQFLGQLDHKIRKTVFGNVGSLISFRVGGEDASILAAEFNPRFSERDIINLGVRDFCIKMSINGELQDAFSGRTLDISPPEDNVAVQCVETSRQNYSRPVAEVQEILAQWEESVRQPAAASGPSLQSHIQRSAPNTPSGAASTGVATGSPQKTAPTSPFKEVKFDEPLI